MSFQPIAVWKEVKPVGGGVPSLMASGQANWYSISSGLSEQLHCCDWVARA